MQKRKKHKGKQNKTKITTNNKKLCMFYETTLARMRYNINDILKWDENPQTNKQTLMLQKEIEPIHPD